MDIIQTLGWQIIGDKLLELEEHLKYEQQILAELKQSVEDWGNSLTPSNDFEHSTDRDDEITPDANTPDGQIPNSWVDESGIRRAVIWDQDMLTRYIFEDGQLKETSVF